MTKTQGWLVLVSGTVAAVVGVASTAPGKVYPHIVIAVLFFLCVARLRGGT